MIVYIIKRLANLIPVLFIVSVFIFILLRSIPGDPVENMMGEETYDPVLHQLFLKKLGLDQPIHIQYLAWLKRLVTGDLGKSLVSGKETVRVIREAWPPTFYLALFAMLIGIIFAIPLGAMAAFRQNTRVDYGIMAFTILGISIPTFWIGIMLVLVFAVFLGLLPSVGYHSPFSNPILFLKYGIMPGLAVGIHEAAAITRMIRSEMLEQLRQDYVRTAHAKGLPKRMVIYKHTLKNSLIPAVTMIGLHVGRILGGMVVIENIFSWPGLGRMVVQAIYSRDYPLVQAGIILIATLYVFSNLLVDILYKWLDPRIRLA